MKTDELKKKITYRSNYRGTKEMDKLLSSFTNRYINELNESDLIDLENLLNIPKYSSERFKFSNLVNDSYK